MNGMTAEQKVQLGAEIQRVRETKPKISRKALVQASEMTLSENTVIAVERGEGSDGSVEKVLTALAALGRAVEIAPAVEEAAVTELPLPTSSSQMVADLVLATLVNAPPGEREELRRNIWLLLRGRHRELIERLSDQNER